MRSVFVDTAYWIAVVWHTDQWALSARRAREALGERARLVTTDEVLSEFLDFMGTRGSDLRRRAAQMVRAILSNPNVGVFHQSHESFLRGLVLYEERPDKGYTLTDCISMDTMRAQGIADALSADQHFAQEGFSVLMRKE